ncbi:hypothetical protein [Pseudonocardia hydrocarbonoxydans]|uniref:DUF2191 domain-containing protein n=1 Tax=Pseudonocardia hydrocarbonoxydans TaxID=76726 RepID=A0A4Y3WM90_9PSEU|nr:hypothetical protein [Pseudonocardia hydrocarbonoxydans]GEC19588.1 hypothetical protein PHY01_18710 [Pseudonocardia hydrocarbonoxydans]
MARIEMDVDDELLGRAALALGTHGAPETVLAALRAAARPGPRPEVPGPLPGERPARSPHDPPGPLDPPARPGDFPRPPEIR